MPKKRLNSQLEKLFSHFGNKEHPHPSQNTEALPAWTCEWDADGKYLTCSSDVETSLGIQAASFIGQGASFGLSPQSAPLLKALFQNQQLPAEVDVYYLSSEGAHIPVHLNIQAHAAGWQVSATVLPSDSPIPQLPATGSLPSLPTPSNAPVAATPLTGLAIHNNQVQTAIETWSTAGETCERTNQPIVVPASPSSPAAIAMPFQVRDQFSGVLELLDDQESRIWSEDDQLLVREVLSQLSLAIENAQLYAAVQQELGERIRAEQEILRRNQDLAALNQIGQRLSKLATPQEIFSLVYEMIGSVLDNNNATIAAINRSTGEISYPICIINGQHSQQPEKIFSKSIVELLMRTRNPLLLTGRIKEYLTKSQIELPNPIPQSMLAVPMLTGERVLGIIALQDYTKESAYSQIQVDLLSNIASQTANALENAYLFQEIQNAFQAIENRERYQANVARAVATLTEQGSASLPTVLELIGQAAKTDRVYFAESYDSDEGVYWRVYSQWQRPGATSTLKPLRSQDIPANRLTYLANQLRERSWLSITPQDIPANDIRWLMTSKTASLLILSVKTKASTPSFIALEEFDETRKWLNEEINVLRVAADALANTFVREDLLQQVQSTLEETENLYNTSHELALANDFSEMISAIAEGLHIAHINRGLILLTEHDSHNNLTGLRTTASWHNGFGSPPPEDGSNFFLPEYQNLFYNQNPIFVDEIHETAIPPATRKLLAENHIRALASLPLQTTKRQIGTFVLLAQDPHPFSAREKRSLTSLADQMATAVENRQLFEQTQVALSETALLYKISSGIASAQNTGDLVTLIAKNVLPQNADRTSIIAIQTTPEGEPIDFEVVGFYDKQSEYQRMGLRLPASSMPLLKTIGNEPIILPNIALSDLDLISKKTLQQFSIASGIIVPLTSSGRLVGIITATARQPAEYTTEEANLLQVTGAGIAIAVERQRLLQEAQRRALELRTAAEIARDTTSTLSSDILLARIVNLVSERFNFYHVAIYLTNEAGNYAFIREASGEAGQSLKQKEFRLAVGSRSLLGSVCANGIPMIVNDVTREPLFYAQSELPETRSEIVLPLKSGSRIIGALDIQSNRANAFSEDDIAVFQILSDQIAVAIENARSYELAQKAVEEMREVDRVKSQFLANMSHELRTPLNSIIGFSRVILKGIDGPVNDTQKQDLTAIYNSGQHLLSLINDILDLSKIEAGKMELQFSDINISDIVVSALSTAVGLTKDKPVKLKQIIPPDLPSVRADSTRVRQVLINFLSNAAKFTEEGDITVEASITTNPQTQGPEIMLTVTDSGPGIEEKDRHKLFQPFSQVDDSPTRKTGGSGLGLSICKSFIEMHKGRIGLLWSEIGRGSCFFFTLPLPMPEPQALPEQIAYTEKIVLAIEDDPQVISLYERYLKPQGYQVVPVTDSTQAIARAVELHPFAITLDVMMPQRDGWQVLAELKANPETRDIPIVICSILEEEEKGFSLGAADYLVKPFLQEDLINAIHRLDRTGKIRRILIVDDSVEDLRLVQKILEESKNFQVMTAQSGTEGMQKMSTEKPDAIILDLFMPDMNGFAILEKMRGDPILSKIPVIILTGADLTPEQHQQLANFGRQLLTKGLLRENELLHTLEQALQSLQTLSSSAS